MTRALEYQCRAELEEARGDFEPEPRTLVTSPLQRLPPVTCVAIRRRHQPQSPQERRPRGRPPGRRGAQSQRVLSGRRGRRELGFEKHNEPFTPGGRGVLDDLPTLPYQQWAIEEKRTRNLPERGYDDPTAHCFVGGVPRAIYVPSPFHILQTSTHVGILHERMSWRIIPLVGHVPLPDTVRLWMGDSVGRWDGQTLVIETRNLNGKTWLNEVGDVIGHAATVTERFTPTETDVVRYEATVTDPVITLGHGPLPCRCGAIPELHCSRSRAWKTIRI